MKKLIAFFFAGASLLIITSCSILPSPKVIEISYFDIGFPAKQYTTDVGVQFSPFIGGVGGETKMVFREATNVIRFDPYNRWSTSPAKLIQCYLLLGLKNKNNKINYVMNGELLRFDCDLNQKTANIALRITIKPYKPKSHDKNFIYQVIYTSSVPVTEKKASAYAKAMGKAMDEITAKIADNLKNMESKR